MAPLGSVEAEIGGLPPDLKRVFTNVLRILVPFLRYGVVEHQQKAENFASYVIVSTTATSTGEFTVAHGIGRAPYRASQVVALNSSGMEFVLMRVSRPADASRMYFRAEAGSTNKVFGLQIE